LIPCNQLCFIRHLTHGGGGIVDLYMWQGKQVVVKKLQLRMCSTDYFDQFSKEAGILRRLRHDNIVGFIGIYFDPPHLGIVMEYW
jgi:serine/threonine protein kinase